MQKSPLEQKKKFPCESPKEPSTADGTKAKWAQEISIWKTIRCILCVTWSAWCAHVRSGLDGQEIILLQRGGPEGRCI